MGYSGPQNLLKEQSQRPPNVPSQYCTHYAASEGQIPKDGSPFFPDKWLMRSDRLCPYPPICRDTYFTRRNLLIFFVVKRLFMDIWSNLVDFDSAQADGGAMAPRGIALVRREANRRRNEGDLALVLSGCARGADVSNCSLDTRPNGATGLVLADENARCGEAWLPIPRDYPTELVNALTHVDDCYHLERHHRPALFNYEAAVRVGAQAGHLMGIMAEARQGIASVV